MKLIRFFDIVISFTSLLLLLPFLILVSIVAIISQGLPIFFKQTRVGKNEEEFKLYKFRSMIVSKAYDKNTIRTKVNDKRITRFGNFIRKTSIDELPQLFNVLLGNMSMVGPRPDTPFQIGDYSRSEWEKRLSVKPGITGFAQIYGRSQITMEKRLYYDLKWVDDISIKNYFFIFFRTFFILLKNTN